MTEKMLTIRLDADEHRALKLHAVLQGRSVNAVVLDLIRSELGRQAPPAGGRTAQQLAADILARFGIDPDSPEHKAAVERARQSVRQAPADGPAQGAA